MLSFRYVTFAVSAILTGAMGSQWVHNMYKPLSDLDELVDAQVKRIKQERLTAAAATKKRDDIPNPPKTKESTEIESTTENRAKTASNGDAVTDKKNGCATAQKVTN